MMRTATSQLPTDLRVLSARCTFTHERLRVPLHMSSGPISELTLAHATVEVEGTQGQRAVGQGMIFLSDLWAWPSAAVDHPARDGVMRELSTRLAAVLPQALDGWGHPLELGVVLHAMLPALTAGVETAEAMPMLAASVCAAPFDAALHDAHGVLHGLSSYTLLGPQALPGDLARFLGPSGQGVTLEEALNLRFSPRVPGCVLIGMADPLRASDVSHPVGDGLPECAEAWLRRSGFYIAKLKVAAKDPRADATWVSTAAHLLRELHAEMGTGRQTWVSVDPNEGYATVEELLAFLRYLQEIDLESYAAMRYIEQPIPRAQSTTLDLHPAAALKPILADEGISGVEQLDELMRAGWSGLALKTCKSHTLCLLLAAWSHLTRRPYSLQDLTNPSFAALHSLNLAAHLRTRNGVELNSPQYTPAANRALAARYPGVFAVREGEHEMEADGVGLYGNYLKHAPYPGTVPALIAR